MQEQSIQKEIVKTWLCKGNKEVNAVMEKIADFGMMSDAGNKKIIRAVSHKR